MSWKPWTPLGPLGENIGGRKPNQEHAVAGGGEETPQAVFGRGQGPQPYTLHPINTYNGKAPEQQTSKRKPSKEQPTGHREMGGEQSVKIVKAGATAWWRWVVKLLISSAGEPRNGSDIHSFHTCVRRMSACCD